MAPMKIGECCKWFGSKHQIPAQVRGFPDLSLIWVLVPRVVV